MVLQQLNGSAGTRRSKIHPSVFFVMICIRKRAIILVFWIPHHKSTMYPVKGFLQIVSSFLSRFSFPSWSRIHKILPLIPFIFLPTTLLQALPLSSVPCFLPSITKFFLEAVVQPLLCTVTLQNFLMTINWKLQFSFFNNTVFPELLSIQTVLLTEHRPNLTSEDCVVILYCW